MKKSVLFLSVAIVLLYTPVFAQQTNFMITPPPIPWFEFTEGQKDLRVTATGIYLTGEGSDPLTGDISVWGAGGGGVYRYAFKDIFAFDIGLMVVGAAGDIGNEVDMTMWLASIPVNLEVLLVNNERIAVIGFIGFGFSRNYIGLTSNIPGSEGTVDLNTALKGPQGGMQVSVKLQNLVISPFLMLTKQSGDVDMDYDIGGDSGSASMSVSTATIYYYGFDIVYVPLGLSLSSLIQQASSSGGNEAFKTYVINISYRTRL